jgi:hypothetical protein
MSKTHLRQSKLDKSSLRKIERALAGELASKTTAVKN